MINNKIILASSSPRRIQMFQDHGFNSIILPSSVDESIPEGMSMEQGVMYLALKKGLAVENQWLKSSNYDLNTQFVVAADTVVFKDKIIGKPIDLQEAFLILKSLRNGSHFVATGVAIIQVGTSKRRLFYDATEVFFHNYSDEIIHQYINNENVLDKAGSYAIQSVWGKNVSHIIGDYDNVMGFPWVKFEQEYSNIKKLL